MQAKSLVGAFKPSPTVRTNVSFFNQPNLYAGNRRGPACNRVGQLFHQPLHGPFLAKLKQQGQSEVGVEVWLRISVGFHEVTDTRPGTDLQLYIGRISERSAFRSSLKSRANNTISFSISLLKRVWRVGMRSD